MKTQIMTRHSKRHAMQIVGRYTAPSSIKAFTGRASDQANEGKGLDEIACIGIAVLDLETTGFLDAPEIGIVEIGVAQCRCPMGHMMPALVAEYSGGVNPGIPIPEGASKVHGIQDQDVAGCPSYAGVAEWVTELLKHHIVCGFNIAQYDMEVLRRQVQRYSLGADAEQAIDSAMILDLREVWVDLQQTKRGNLARVAEHYGVPAGVAHSAIGDVQTSMNILAAMIEAHGEDSIMRYVRRLNRDDTPSELDARQMRPA